MKTKSSDTLDSIVVLDRSNRRKFIRTGAAFLLSSGGVAVHHAARADECDRATGEKNPEHANSDSDAGTGADRQGCGRQKDKPKITRFQRSTQPGKHVGVDKVKA